jgi:hypothetical protein
MDQPGGGFINPGSLDFDYNDTSYHNPKINGFEDDSFDDFDSYLHNPNPSDPFFDITGTLAPQDLHAIYTPQQNFLNSIPAQDVDVSGLSFSQFDHQYNAGSAFPHVQQPPSTSASTPNTSFQTTPEQQAKVPKKLGRKRKIPKSKAEEEETRSKFLERNRVAASKCREKKKHWQDGLEHRKLNLEREKMEFLHEINVLRAQVEQLTNVCRWHVQMGCPMQGLEERLVRLRELGVGGGGEVMGGMVEGVKMDVDEMDFETPRRDSIDSGVCVNMPRRRRRRVRDPASLGRGLRIGGGSRSRWYCYGIGV